MPEQLLSINQLFQNPIYNRFKIIVLEKSFLNLII
jgi:hypothetical protein